MVSTMGPLTRSREEGYATQGSEPCLEAFTVTTLYVLTYNTQSASHTAQVVVVLNTYTLIGTQTVGVGVDVAVACAHLWDFELRVNR